jgi:histidinol-phosphate phosphatase family protein
MKYPKINAKNIPTIILCGGLGTRMREETEYKPKPMVLIGGKPIIEHQILLFKRYGIRRIWILLGHQGNKIKEYFGDGRKWKVKIYYHQEKEPMGTAGALKILENKIKKDFLVVSGDVMMNIDLRKFINWHKKQKGIATFIVHPNDHPFDSDLVEINKDKRIIAFLKRPHPSNRIFHNLSIASIYIFSPRIFQFIPKNRKSDIEKDILPKILKSEQKIYAYKTSEYIKDIGTPNRLMKVRKDYVLEKLKKITLKNTRKAVFLDRDGVINEEIDQLSRLKNLKIYDFSAKAIKQINDLGYLAIIITNQPMIAKGFMTIKDLDEIHKKLETELGKQGAKIDAFYYCPHHPEKGFPGEISELKIECNCRKPKIGLFLKAKKEFNINFKKSYMIGDQTSDILAGKRAGCKTILVKTGYGGKDNLFSVSPDFVAQNLLESIYLIQ